MPFQVKPTTHNVIFDNIDQWPGLLFLVFRQYWNMLWIVRQGNTFVITRYRLRILIVKQAVPWPWTVKCNMSSFRHVGIVRYELSCYRRLPLLMSSLPLTISVPHSQSQSNRIVENNRWYRVINRYFKRFKKKKLRTGYTVMYLPMHFSVFLADILYVLEWDKIEDELLTGNEIRSYILFKYVHPACLIISE